MTDKPDQLWETHARWWQDEFTDGADAEYVEQIIPLAVTLLAGRQRIADVGTGDGQIVRALTASDAERTVVGFDPTRSQIAVAHQRDQTLDTQRPGRYMVAGAESMPVAANACDGVLACLVFEHIDDHVAAIEEVARILEPGGRFVFMLNHPLLQTPGSGWIDDQILEEAYWRIGDYLVETATVEEVQKDVFIPFVHRPLHRYLNALSDAGLMLTRMIEPSPPEGFLDRADAFRKAQNIPRLLVLVSEKVRD